MASIGSRATSLPDCPGDDTLIALVTRALAPGEVAAIERHVDNCSACRATIGHLAALEEPASKRVLGRYRLDSMLGQGAMGTVWKAWDPMLERALAIKLLKPEIGEHGHARMLREARSLAKLQHPNVMAIHDLGTFDGEVFIATELIDGEPLDRWQTTHGPTEILSAYAQAARGLAAAHALGLVHRDVKPNNIMVGLDGRVRVGDFGLVTTDRALAETAMDGTPDGGLTQAGAVVGTPAYMAPEQRRGAVVDARADQFGLCMGLAEALIGIRPPADVDAATLRKQSLIAAPWSAIARGLARDPANRFPDMSQLAAALDPAISQTAVAHRSSSSRAALLVPVAMVLAALAGGAIYEVSSGHRDPVSRPLSPPVPVVAVQPQPAPLVVPVATPPPPPPAPIAPAAAVPGPPRTVIAKAPTPRPVPTKITPPPPPAPVASEQFAISPPGATPPTAPALPQLVNAQHELQHLLNQANGRADPPCAPFEQSLRAVLAERALYADPTAVRQMSVLVAEVAECYGDREHDCVHAAAALAFGRQQAGLKIPNGNVSARCESTWTTQSGQPWQVRAVTSAAPGVAECDDLARLSNKLGTCSKLSAEMQHAMLFAREQEADRIRAMVAKQTAPDTVARSCKMMASQIQSLVDHFECW